METKITTIFSPSFSAFISFLHVPENVMQIKAYVFLFLTFQQSEDYFIYHDRHFDVNLAAFLRGEAPAQKNGKKLINGKPEEAFGNVEARLPTLGINQTAKDGEWQTVLGTR